MRLKIILRASRAIIPYLLERCWGLNSDTARRLGSVLSQGVEFAFVLLATDVIQGVISEPRRSAALPPPFRRALRRRGVP